MIGLAQINQTLDKPDNMLNVLGGFRRDGGPEHIERVHFIVKFVNIFCGDSRAGVARLIGFFDNFIIHIRKIAHIGHLIPELHQPAVHHVKHHHGTGMTDMAGIIYRGTAHVHAGFIGSNWNKFFFFPAQGIINP